MFIFNALYDTLTVILRPSKKMVVGAEVIREPGLKAEFVHGVFKTEDQEIADLLRKKIKGDRMVLEVTSEDQLAFERGTKALNQRGPSSALDLKTDSEKARLVEKPVGELKCPICDSAHKTQAALNLHLVSHRSSVQEKKPA